jgi:dTDP-4-dehydrorhamnose reductase
MKIFVTGVNGQLGHDVMNELIARGYNCIGSDISPVYSGLQDGSAVCNAPYLSLDITDRLAVFNVFDRIRPEAVIHCAAWTDVDAAEDEGNVKKVFTVNVEGTRNIALACRNQGSRMMYISTDYVFDGQGTTPWTPECECFDPLNVYGQSKLEGEQVVKALLQSFFIVRISWAFGASGRNFIKSMLELGRSHDALRVVNDQIGTPTYTVDLSRLLVDMIVTEKYGVYHVTNEGGYISWAEYAVEIFRQAHMETKVIPVTTAEYGVSRAQRPLNSRLDKRKLVEHGFSPLPDWKDALRRYLVEHARTEG